MLTFVKFIGIIMIGMGTTFLLDPIMLKQIISFWKQEKRFYIAAILRILLGTIFLLAASRCRLVGVILALGILILGTGVSIFFIGLERIKSILNWFYKSPLTVLRVVAIVALAIGALILYSA